MKLVLLVLRSVIQPLIGFGSVTMIRLKFEIALQWFNLENMLMILES
jgi:hypothetical protein